MHYWAIIAPCIGSLYMEVSNEQKQTPAGHDH